LGDKTPVTFRFETDSVHATFQFKRADIAALASGGLQSIQGTYQRGQVDVDDPDANGRDPQMALLEVQCSETIPAPTPAPSPTPIGDLVASCSGCHGENGVSPVPGVPNIGGQKLHMLTDELKFYRNGSRTDTTMQAMNAIAGSLADADIEAIATYYSQQSRPQPAASLRHVTPSPEVARCCGCHSSQGALAGTPWGDIYLTSQSETMLAAQLVQLRDNARPDFVPRYILSGYTDEQLANFAAYFASETADQVCTDVPPADRAPMADMKP
jgi:cytochrome c553